MKNNLNLAYTVMQGAKHAKKDLVATALRK